MELLTHSENIDMQLIGKFISVYFLPSDIEKGQTLKIIC